MPKSKSFTWRSPKGFGSLQLYILIPGSMYELPQALIVQNSPIDLPIERWYLGGVAYLPPWTHASIVIWITLCQTGSLDSIREVHLGH